MHRTLLHLLRWTLLILPVSLTAGSLVALFLWLLDKAIVFRFGHTWLLFLLPAAGVLIYFLYKYLGKNAEAGNNLIMDEIHEPGGGVPARMAPLVLGTTVLTHLFGGSAGREGTAVQIGGSVAQWWARRFGLTAPDVRILLTTGIAAGFGAVFGTPVAGAIFALEVLALGRMRYDALLPCLIASVGADLTCKAWGIHHTAYAISSPFHIDWLRLLEVIGAGALFGLAGWLFSETTHAVKRYGNRWVRPAWLLPILGGGLVILMTFILGTQDYLSLGVLGIHKDSVTIPSCFHAGGASSFSWLWKLVFTAVTLGTGFKGGEVTPLFFVGAALGNTLAVLSGAPVDLMAGLGFIAVFAGATNTPIACTIMGVELFGAGNLLYYAIACFTAYYFSGHSGIYPSQRVGVSKVDAFREHTGATLREVQHTRLNVRKQWLKKWKNSCSLFWRG
ncbi:MAG TPA: voltage-gated chloride channel family protein [Dinghuibacter sp.]|uniref:voltage-gated chloride channel family protein n=1 Tax=Dinghuibacter sp. TaxID=2024697 RepID=UPI002C240E20|nr:voltage-gated chloride channel family protein [Dinghuibacter sp.]HTJ15096.1 voltage-gated chloride channel family protein [Dinghuibacter sp.]